MSDLMYNGTTITLYTRLVCLYILASPSFSIAMSTSPTALPSPGVDDEDLCTNDGGHPTSQVQQLVDVQPGLYNLPPTG
jgi:hypothetical protein